MRAAGKRSRQNSQTGKGLGVMDEARTVEVDEVRGSGEAGGAASARRMNEPSQTPLDTLSDADLLARILAQDHAAFSALMQRYNRTLYRAARSVAGDEAEAEDIVQEAWVRAYTHFRDFRGESRLATWLVRITLNEALGRKRRARTILEISEIDNHDGTRVMTPPSSLTDPESDLSRTQLRRMLEEAINTLPPAFRSVFVLRAIEEMSVEEIALQLGIPEATVRTRMHRSRALLGKAIEEKLGGCGLELFPFAGRRCESLRERVLARISPSGAPR
jgi:RNA polymerase sigma-70 factor (ECF subfamily)